MTTMRNATTPPTHVPEEATPEATCPYCDRPFQTTRARDLHVGEDHPEESTTEEYETYESARESERDELFLYHIKVVIALGVIYAVTVLGYMIVLSGGLT